MSLLWIAIAAVIPLSLEASAAAELSSGTRDRPVEVEAEPFHSIRLVNSTIRVYEALIPAGEQTLFHTHRQNGAGVDLTAAQLHIEKVGADPVDLTTKPGDIFPVDLEAPFAHRVSNVGSVAYRVIVAELVQPPVANAAPSTVTETPSYKLELENERVRAYRLVLRPGEATRVHTLSASTLTISLSGGQLSVTPAGGTSRYVSLAPGAVEWNSEPSTLTIMNVGVARYESVYFEWKPQAR